MGIATLLGFVTLEAILIIFTISIVRSRTAIEGTRSAFIFLLISLSVWTACNYFSNLSSLLHHDTLYLVNQMLFASSVIAAIGAMYFIDAVLGTHSRRLSVSCIVAGLGAVILSFTPLVVRDIHLESISVAIDFGVASIVYFAILIFIISAVALKLIQGMRSPIRRIHEYARVLLISLGGVMVALVITNIIAPVIFNNFAITVFGPFLTVGLIVGVGYAIVRHGLFDIRLAVVRSVAYSLVFTVMIALYFGLVYVASLVIHSPLAGTATTLLYAAVSVAMAMFFQPIKHFFDRLTNRIFYRENYERDDFLIDISRALNVTTDLRGLLERASVEIDETLKPEQVHFLIYKKDNRYTTAGTSGRRAITLSESHQIDNYVAANGDSIIITELLDEAEGVSQLLQRAGIALSIPLTRGGTVLGYLFLGERRSGDYTTRDIKTLNTITGELAIAVQNALSIQEVKDLNANLQQRIDDATKELRASNEKLHRLDVAKDEFVSMASHQLRTPLTSVKGYISMVLEGDAGKISDMQAKLLGEAFTSSERMVHLINDFLNVSRLQTGKFMLDRRQVDLAGVVKQEVDSLQTTAKSRNIKLLYRQPSVFPVLYLDEGKLRQVVMNFIDNAFYYSREFSSVTIKAATDGPDVVVTVQDSGMGVPEVEQKRLFTKFFRATNARKQRPDGTGVGLFLAKKVIVAHGGTMIFESVEGKGSTFGFRLPIKKLSLAPTDDADQLDN